MLDYVHVERSEIEETGEYDLEGLFIRLGYAIDSIGAKRVVLDTLEVAVRRPFQHGHPARRAAAPVPLAQGPGRHGRHHRRARRGHADPPRAGGVRLRLRDPARPPGRRTRSPPGGCAWSSTAARLHGTNEYPFLIDEHGIAVLPDHLAGAAARGARPSGSPAGMPGARRDAGRPGLLPGQQRAGLRHGGHRQDQPRRPFRRRGLPARRALRSTSPSRNRRPRFIRNMRSIGLDLAPWVEKGLLHFHAAAPDAATAWRRHLVTMHKLVRDAPAGRGGPRSDHQLPRRRQQRGRQGDAHCG